MPLGLTPLEQAQAIAAMKARLDNGEDLNMTPSNYTPNVPLPEPENAPATPPPPTNIFGGNTYANVPRYAPGGDDQYKDVGTYNPGGQYAGGINGPAINPLDYPQYAKPEEAKKAKEDFAKGPVLPASYPTPTAQQKPQARPGSGGAIGANPMTGLMNQADSFRQEQIDARNKDNDILGDADRASEDRQFGQMAAHQNFIDEQTRIAAEKKAIEDKAMASADQRDQEIRSQIQQLQKEGIDPDHWWHSKSTGTQIMAALSMAAGAFGAGVPHAGGSGRNYAMEMINGAIERDVAAQKTNYEKKWDVLTRNQELNKNEHARNMFVADQKQREELTARYKLDAQLSSYDSEFNNATFRQKTQQARIDNQDKIDQLKMQGVQDRMGLLQRQQASQAAANAAANDPFSKIPPKERAEATKELKAAQDFQSAQAELEAAKAGGDYKTIAAATSRLMTLGGVKGKENADITKDVGSWTGKIPFITKSAQESADQYAGTVAHPSTPTLDRYGIRVGGNAAPQGNVTPGNPAGGIPLKR